MRVDEVVHRYLAEELELENPRDVDDLSAAVLMLGLLSVGCLLRRPSEVPDRRLHAVEEQANDLEDQDPQSSLNEQRNSLQDHYAY